MENIGQKKSEKAPKVFISYAWANKNFVLRFAQDLTKDGIDVIIDEWNLKPGNDKYAFMESMVRDKTIERVLIMCDRVYKERADNRQGGVGDETVIISPQLYQEMEQTKFVPIVLEHDDEGNPCKPIYINSRIHFDFSSEDNYEYNYLQLLRFLYSEPYYIKPKIGQKPDLLRHSGNNYIKYGMVNIKIQGENPKDETSEVTVTYLGSSLVDAEHRPVKYEDIVSASFGKIISYKFDTDADVKITNSDTFKLSHKRLEYQLIGPDNESLFFTGEIVLTHKIGRKKGYIGLSIPYYAKHLIVYIDIAKADFIKNYGGKAILLNTTSKTKITQTFSESSMTYIITLKNTEPADLSFAWEND